MKFAQHCFQVTAIFKLGKSTRDSPIVKRKGAGTEQVAHGLGNHESLLGKVGRPLRHCKLCRARAEHQQEKQQKRGAGGKSQYAHFLLRLAQRVNGNNAE